MFGPWFLFWLSKFFDDLKILKLHLKLFIICLKKLHRKLHVRVCVNNIINLLIFVFLFFSIRFYKKYSIFHLTHFLLTRGETFLHDLRYGLVYIMLWILQRSHQDRNKLFYCYSSTYLYNLEVLMIFGLSDFDAYFNKALHKQ